MGFVPLLRERVTFGHGPKSHQKGHLETLFLRTSLALWRRCLSLPCAARSQIGGGHRSKVVCRLRSGPATASGQSYKPSCSSRGRTQGSAPTRWTRCVCACRRERRIPTPASAQAAYPSAHRMRHASLTPLCLLFPTAPADAGLRRDPICSHRLGMTDTSARRFPFANPACHCEGTKCPWQSVFPRAVGDAAPYEG